MPHLSDDDEILASAGIFSMGLITWSNDLSAENPLGAANKISVSLALNVRPNNNTIGRLFSWLG
jgi:hypothetical protein